MKLDIQSVTFKNFLSFGSKEQEIVFHNGVNVVLGHDVATGRSNGSGKSSFLETIPFALFGQTHKEIKKEQLINWKNRRGCEVAINFLKGEVPYRVVRAIKPDTFEIYEEDQLIEKPAHVRDYQKTLEQIIGLNFNTFCSLIHSNVNSSNKILSMKKADKRKFIENVFGLGVYSSIHKNATDKIRNTNTKISEHVLRMSHNERAVKDAVNRANDISEKMSGLGSHDVELKDLNIELDELIERYGDVESRLEAVTKEHDELEADMKCVRALELKVIPKIKIVEQWLKNVKTSLKEIDDSRVIREQYFSFVAEYGGPKDVVEQIDLHKAEIAKWDNERMVAETKLKQASIDVATAAADVKHQKDKIDNLKEHDECPTCEQSLKQGKKDVIGKLEKELHRLISVKDDCVSKENNARKERNGHQDTINSIKEAMKVWEERRDYLYRLKDRINIEHDEHELKRKKERFEKTGTKLQGLEVKLIKQGDKLDHQISLLEDKEREFANKAVKIKKKREAISLLEERIKLKKQAKKDFENILDQEEQNIADLNYENMEIEKKRRLCINIVDHLDIIKEICKDENIKQYAISSIMPYLNRQANHYLSEVGYGFYTLLDKWLDAEIKGPGITKASYGSLSGGEARGIDLAIQFALLDIARIQAGIWPDILIMDEILDSSVDGKGIDKLMQIIRAKQAEENSKIFIISHRDEIGDEFDADHVYNVKKDGYSEVTVE
jgi:DNA repair exonuclease SbcCD ATPase subunit